jgi:hypothetical protein
MEEEGSSGSLAAERILRNDRGRTGKKIMAGYKNRPPSLPYKSVPFHHSPVIFL